MTGEEEYEEGKGTAYHLKHVTLFKTEHVCLLMELVPLYLLMM